MLYSLYIRDRWNVTPRLTFNYGIRWEYFPYPTRPIAVWSGMIPIPTRF